MLLVLRLLLAFSEDVVDVMLVAVEAQVGAGWRCELEVVRVVAEAAVDCTIITFGFELKLMILP